MTHNTRKNMWEIATIREKNFVHDHLNNFDHLYDGDDDETFYVLMDLLLERLLFERKFNLERVSHNKELIELFDEFDKRARLNNVKDLEVVGLGLSDIPDISLDEVHSESVHGLDISL